MDTLLTVILILALVLIMLLVGACIGATTQARWQCGDIAEIFSIEEWEIRNGKCYFLVPTGEDYKGWVYSLDYIKAQTINQ